jgi:hypothetical protein
MMDMGKDTVIMDTTKDVKMMMDDRKEEEEKDTRNSTNSSSLLEHIYFDQC